MVVIALSASVFEHNRQQSLEAGCHDFVPKPVQAEVLLDKLQECLGLEWTYEEPPPSVQAKTERTISVMSSPPPQTVDEFCELANIGDVRRILGQLDDLEAQGDEYLPFVATMRRLAGEYDMKQITEFLARLADDAHEHEVG